MVADFQKDKMTELNDVQSVQADPYKSLKEAESLLNARAYEAASIALGTAREYMPDNYWVNLLAARINAGLGQFSAMEIALYKAISTKDPSRIGAICDLVHYQLSKGIFKEIDLLDEAIELCAESSQKLWYYSQLLLQKALVTLRFGHVEESNNLVEKAYEFRRHFGEELDYAYPWVTKILDSLSLEHWSSLEYLKRRFSLGKATIDYSEELRNMSDETFVLEIGAMDGVRFDQLRSHIIGRKWSAIVVEPLSDMFESLRDNYKDQSNVRCANVAITDKAGPVTMYRITTEAAAKGGHDDWVLGLSSINKSFLLDIYSDYVTEEIVEGITFNDLTSFYGIKHIDVLQIDTEGHDLSVLQQIDLIKWCIPLIRIEILHLMPSDRLKVFNILSRHGYRFSFDGGDLTAKK